MHIFIVQGAKPLGPVRIFKQLVIRSIDILGRSKMETLMTAVADKVRGPVAGGAALIDIERSQSVAAGHDILVEERAVAVNPVDDKV